MAASGERLDVVGGEVAGAAAVGAPGVCCYRCSCAPLVRGAVAALGRRAAACVSLRLARRAAAPRDNLQLRCWRYHVVLRRVTSNGQSWLSGRGDGWGVCLIRSPLPGGRHCRGRGPRNAGARRPRPPAAAAEGQGRDELRPYGRGIGQSGSVPVPLASVQTMRPWIDGLIGELAAMKSATSASIRFRLVDLKATLG